ncbi:MAG TPA: hypothetical protein VNI20_08045 [Fimbriimonadaceae bacterium]|nr:hypothetical protein [Fimbriimonadaceae bacterium]
MRATTDETPRAMVDGLLKFIDEAHSANGGASAPIKPTHRVPFHWPPHPISYDYHVLASDWTGKAQFDAHGKTFDVKVARTPMGVFGRCEEIWNEARGDTLEQMLDALREGCTPYFERQRVIAKTLGQEGLFEGQIIDLPALGLVKLLYCTDRDVAHDAHTIIETKASTGLFTDALIEVLRDRKHPARRIAQWCVLDMFEDLPAFCATPDSQNKAILAIRDLIWSAEDDYARTIYKAGVVLGGHVCTETAADALIACVAAPSRVGRRAAIHAVFHLNEWMPSRKDAILKALEKAASSDEEPQLREFAACMVRDIESGAAEHVTEPVFPDEA